jgi:hypothetical protein
LHSKYSCFCWTSLKLSGHSFHACSYRFGVAYLSSTHFLGTISILFLFNFLNSIFLEFWVGLNSTLQNRLVRWWLPLLINPCSCHLISDLGLLTNTISISFCLLTVSLWFVLLSGILLTLIIWIHHFQHYTSTETCFSAFKAPLEPTTALGGFSGNNYSEVRSCILTDVCLCITYMLITIF